MSGLLTSLNHSAMALNAQSRAIEVAGKNLANVNNPSYARQRVLFGDRGTVVSLDGSEGLGTEALAVQQLRDVLLDRQVMREVGLESSFNAQQQAYQRAQSALGQNVDRSGATTGSGGATGGLSAALDDFFNGFQGLASLPTDVGQRQSLLEQSRVLVDRFRQTDVRLAQVQSDLDLQVQGDVTEVNRLLGAIADLNAQIGRIEIRENGAAVDLRDQRQARLEELVAKLPVDVRNTENGQIQIVVKDSAGTDVVLVDRASVAQPVSFNGTGLVAGGASVAASSGSIQGALTARDGAVRTLRTGIDQLAAQLVTAVNGAYNPAGTPGGNLFDPAGLTAATIALQPGLTAATLRTGTGAAGDNSIALAVASLASRTFATAGGDLIDGTLGGHLSGVVTGLGEALASANTRAADQASITQLVRNQRAGVSGVSLDEEMSDLVRFQRAFQASSRVFSVVDELLDTVVNRLGRG